MGHVQGGADRLVCRILSGGRRSQSWADFDNKYTLVTGAVI
jgi:hypothetical protein